MRKNLLRFLFVVLCLLVLVSCGDDDDDNDDTTDDDTTDDDTTDDDTTDDDTTDDDTVDDDIVDDDAADDDTIDDDTIDDDTVDDDDTTDDDTTDDDTVSEPFTMGWYGGVPYEEDPSAGMIGTGATFTLYYHFGYLPDELVQTRLDQAYANGLQVIMNVDGVTQVGPDVVSVDAERVGEFVATFKDHPAIVGWYTADEPSGFFQKMLCQTAYDAVKQADPEHLVYLCSNHSDGNTIPLFASTYDVLIYDTYVFEQGEEEFYGLENHGSLWWKETGLKKRLRDAAAKADRVGKPWMFAAQGFGRALGCSTRLPTFAEHRFQTYYALRRGARGIVAFAYITALESVADPGDAYPYSGVQWVTDVYQPLAEEIAALGNALGVRPDTNHVADDADTLYSCLFRDPDDDTVYLFALNEADDTFDAEFAITLSGEWAEAVPVDGGSAIPLTDNHFTDAFDRYEVKVYELIPAA